MESIDFLSFEMIGTPEVLHGKATFDGIHDGLYLGDFHLQFKKKLKVSLEIKPETGGGFEQRFVHLGDPGGDRTDARLMLELRSIGENWYLDVYYSNGENGIALIDENRLYPHGQWYKLEIVLSDQGITGTINGREECHSREVPYRPLPDGLSLGVRQNLVSWFKGSIRELSIGEENE